MAYYLEVLDQLVMTRPQQRIRKLAAAVCLFAVALFYIPYAGAAWYTTQHLCCANGLCEVHNHKHDMMQESQDHDGMAMDCGHNMSHMSGCKMSCCKTTEQAAVNSQVFVMPAIHFNLQPSPAMPQLAPPEAQSLSQYEKPQSPPPRLIAA